MARVVAFREGRAFAPPARHPLAYLLALFVPRLMGRGGGAVLSLLFVLAIIGAVAALAIPSLLSARISANEAGAIGEITTVVSAQAEYAKQHGRFASLACLAAQPGCDAVPASPPLIDGALASSGPRHGYNYHLKLGAGNAAQFAYTAVPVTAGSTGRRAFCADSSGTIGFTVAETIGGEGLTGEGASCNPSLSLLGGS